MTLAQAKANRRRYNRLKKAGLCTLCGQVEAIEWKLCQVCITKRREYNKARYSKCVQM